VSAWRIGSEPPQPELRLRARAGTTPRDTTQALVDRLTKWIPGDTLAIYVPGVTALSAGGGSKPSVLFLIVVIACTPCFVLGAAWASGRPIQRQTSVAAALGAVAFVIWSLTVPLSGWQRWRLIAEHKTGVAIGAGIAGILFGQFAEGLTRRVTPRAKRARVPRA
jgi:hypothetical protein